MHTHFDAQVFWDGALTPSPLHGVTTALAGNCGFTIAPLSNDPSDGEYLMRMLARVEGMPLEALRAGVPWGEWTTSAEYLDAVDRRLGINAGFMVGHSALRRVVMGAEASRRGRRPRTRSGRMGRLVHDALDAGALGFSSSWARTHNDLDRGMLPAPSTPRAARSWRWPPSGRGSLWHLARVHPHGRGRSSRPWAVDLSRRPCPGRGRPLFPRLKGIVMVANAANLAKCRRSDDRR